jgi:hypothetical protein
MKVETTQPDLTVGEVKAKIQNIYLIPAGDQTLSFSGERLENTRKVSDYGIGHNAKLDIVVDADDQDAKGVWDHEGRNNAKAGEGVTEEQDWISAGVADLEEFKFEGVQWVENEVFGLCLFFFQVLKSSTYTDISN